MSDGREHPDEARGRSSFGAWPTGIPTTHPTATPLGETVTPPLGSPFGSQSPTRTYQPGSSSETRAIYATPRIDDPAAAEGHSEQVRLLFGKYLVVRKLGEGAMGEVWLVRHRDLGAERALKLINLGRFSDPEMRARARREARAMALFSHPNAVAVHDANADGDLAYIEMEYIRGRSLNKVLEPGVPKPLEWVADIVDQLGAVLEVAHSHGIVHRDLKPSNMMLLDTHSSGREHLKILDFGIAKILHADEHGHDELQTRAGATIGTPAYMSPEQIDSDATKLDGRSDLYSVGVILFEMLTGRRPFTSTSFKLTYDHLYTPPPSFAEANGTVQIPQEVERLVLRCLEKDPDLRPQSARELRDEFLRLAAPPPPTVDLRPPPSRRRGLVAMLVTLMGLTIGVSSWFALRPRPFALHAPEEVRLTAGESTVITIMAEGGRSQTAEVQPDRVPPDIVVAKLSDGSQARMVQFSVQVDLNAPAGVKTLSFRGNAGASKNGTEVRLKVAPPSLKTPKGYEPAPGSLLEEDNGKVYPKQIVRDLGDGVRLEFLFIKRNTSKEPASFYIMRDKVSNRIFARFAETNPGRLQSSKWRKPKAGELDFPVFQVSAEDACQFADWLGQGAAPLRLPRVDQWDKASGYFDATTQAGSYLEPWKPGDSTIAVGLDRPAPVGSSSHDINFLGCRDMAGNGYEWTRNSRLEGRMLPFEDGQSFPIMTRGQSYRNSKPRTYEEYMEDDGLMMVDPDKSRDDLTFRLVIDEI